MKLKSLVIFVLVLTIAYSGYWYYLAYYAESYLSDRLDELESSGAELEYKSFKVSGFPYRLILELKDAEITLVNDLVRFEVTSPRMEIFVQPWNFSHLIASADISKMRIILNRTGYSRFSVETGPIRASLRKTSDGGTRLSFEGTSAAFARERGLANPPFDYVSVHLRIHGNDTAIANAENRLFAPEIADISFMARREVSGFESDSLLLSALEFQITIRGHQMPEPQADSFASWRDGGGTFEVNRVMLAWASDALIGTGSLALDETLRPLGALNLQTSNVALLANFLSHIGLIDGDAAQALVMPAGQETGPSGDIPINLAMMIQNGRIMISGVSLGIIESIINDR